MAYTPTTWQTGDTITAALLNKAEQGIAGAGALFVQVDFDFGTLDKTWQEIHDASLAVPVVLTIEDGAFIDVYQLTNVSSSDNQYTVSFGQLAINPQFVEFVAESSSDYPVIVE